jgi:predicted transcriptional regulator
MLDKGRGFMSIVVTLSPELEALLCERAAQQGQEIDLVVSEMLASVLEWEKEDSELAIQEIQEGLDDFEAGRFQSFEDFAEERRRKYNLPTDS